MRKLFLVVSISFLSLNFASASYLHEKDIITDQVDIVSADERAKASKLKSPGGWEVKQTAYNKSTKNIEVVAQKGDKLAHVALSTVEKSWRKRITSFLASAISKGLGFFSWLPYLISTTAPDNYELFDLDKTNYLLRPKEKDSDSELYYYSIPSYYYTDTYYFTNPQQAIDFLCPLFAYSSTVSYTWKVKKLIEVKDRHGVLEGYNFDCQIFWRSELSNNITVRIRKPSGKPIVRKDHLAREAYRRLPDHKPSRDLFRRSAEYDVSAGLYDDALDNVAKPATSVKFQPGTAPVVKSDSDNIILPVPIPDTLPGTSPSPSTNPSPRPNEQPVPSPSTSPDTLPGTSPSPSTNPSPRPNEQPVPSPSTSPNPGGMNVQFPNFCDWASTICTLADYLRKKEVDPKTGKFIGDERDDIDTYDVDVLEFDKTAMEFDQDYLNYGGSCPAAVKFSIDVGAVAVPLEFTLQPLCDFAKTVRPAILALAYLAAMGIVANAIRG